MPERYGDAVPNRSRRLLRALVTLTATTSVALTLTGVAQAQDRDPGALVGSTASPAPIPGSVDARRITYWSVGSQNEPALSTGGVYLPPGEAPEGGWPVIAWAHGTSGLGDDCAPSVVGPTLPDRDFPYLQTWLNRGYAIVATDYVGLGTPGVMPYLDGKVQAHSVVDSVAAARELEPTLSNRWVAIGQSQGGGAAVTTARYATEYGGDGLDYLGAVGTGVPANIELVLLPLGPGVPPVAIPDGLTSYVFYILAGLRAAHPEIDLNSYLTPLGRQWVDTAETQCANPFHDAVSGLRLGDMFSRPLAQIPNVYGLLNDYMGVPTSGYDRPVFIGQGLRDVDVPAPSALSLAAAMTANGEPLTFRTYPGDHSQTFRDSQPDAIAFVDRLFGR